MDDDDVAAIRAIIGRVEAGFNAKNPELAIEDFAEDASVVTATGRRIQGRAALLEAHREGFAGPLADEYARYEVADVAFPAADVALAHKLAWPVAAPDDPAEGDPAMVALYVMARRDGRWWVVARANVPMAVPS
jgi:uncharacterized protein (TIGR02246 family)